MKYLFTIPMLLLAGMLPAGCTHVSDDADGGSVMRTYFLGIPIWERSERTDTQLDGLAPAPPAVVVEPAQR